MNPSTQPLATVSDSHRRSDGPPAVMANIRKLNELYGELDQIIASVRTPSLRQM